MSEVRIAIVDDREDVRRSVVSTLEDAIENQELGDTWSILEVSPLGDVDDYPDWIRENSIGILIIDERLNELPSGEEAVDYLGSDVVSVIREHYKGLPIYGMTSYPTADALERNFGLFDDIVQRDELSEKADSYLQRFMRSYQSFLDVNESELAELNTLSEKIATKQANSIQKTRARAIQQNLSLRITAPALSTRSEWIDKYDDLASQLNETIMAAQEYLGSDTKESEG